MDNHISPEITAILDQLDAMKDSVIIAGRTLVDENNANHAAITQLRYELENADKYNNSLRKKLKTESKIAEASTISMIISWAAAAVCFAGWILS